MLVCFSFGQVFAQDLQADNMLLAQRASGGWSKHFQDKALDYNAEFSAETKAAILAEAKKDDANIDNGSTAKEIRYLVKIYKKTNNAEYLAAAEKGIQFLLNAQYENGGWPQYYPDKSSYRGHVTFNDNAMINALKILEDITLKQNGFEVVNAQLIEPSATAVRRGIQCILKTQVRVDGKLTAWCQQYDRITLQPAKARAYELPSISGSESVNIVEFLMDQPNPSPEITTAISAAIAWYNTVKIAGFKVVALPVPGSPKGTDKQLVEDPASTIWARYYEIGTNKPFFCDRDGVVKYSMQEIGYERRNGYAWYGNWAKQLLEKHYPAWAKLHLKTGQP